jgi:hypothetical protein
MTVLSLPSSLAPQPSDVALLPAPEDGSAPLTFTQLLTNAMVQLLNVHVKEAK